MRYYFAAFTQDSDGVSVFFPDVPEAITCGTDMDDAMFMAADALKVSLEEYQKAGKPVPEPSSMDEAERKAREWFADVHSMSNAPFFMQMVQSPDLDRTPVRVTMSLTRCALDALDRKAKAAGLTRSGYVAAMALA